MTKKHAHIISIFNYNKLRVDTNIGILVGEHQFADWVVLHAFCHLLIFFRKVIHRVSNSFNPEIVI